MAERERILSSKRYKIDHEPFDWAKEYMELMDGAWDDWRENAKPEASKEDKKENNTNVQNDL